MCRKDRKSSEQVMVNPDLGKVRKEIREALETLEGE